MLKHSVTKLTTAAAWFVIKHTMVVYVLNFYNPNYVPMSMLPPLIVSFESEITDKDLPNYIYERWHNRDPDRVLFPQFSAYKIY